MLALLLYPNLALCSKALRLNMEQGMALVKDHFASLEIRGDTKASLLIGVCVGLAVVSIMAAYPGKPIDYSGVGECSQPRLLALAWYL